jgi:hypothetical protein
MNHDPAQHGEYDEDDGDGDEHDDLLGWCSA